MDPSQTFSDSSSTSGNPSASPFAPAGGEPAPEGGGEPQIDPEKLRAALTHFQTENEGLKSQIAEMRQSGQSQAEILEKIKSVFVPQETPPGQNEADADKAFLDNVLEVALPVGHTDRH